MSNELFEQKEIETGLQAVINESGLDLSESEIIKQSYASFFIEIAEIKDLSKKIDFENPSDLDEKIARDLRLRMVKVRTGSENVKNERKRIHMLKADVEQKAWNLIKVGCQLEEEILLQVEKKREIAEKLRKEQLKNERLELLIPLGFQHENGFNLGDMDDSMFQSLLKGLELAKKEKEEAEAKAELERLENIRKEAEEKERMRVENERLKSEAEAKEKQLAEERAKAEAEKQALIKKQQAEAKILAEKQAKEKAIADEKQRIETEKQNAILEKERKEKAELEAKIKAKEEAEKKRIAEEKAKADAIIKAKELEEKAKADAEKKLAKASDKIKLETWFKTLSIGEFDATILKADSGLVYNEIMSKFEGFQKWANDKINSI